MMTEPIKIAGIDPSSVCTAISIWEINQIGVCAYRKTVLIQPGKKDMLYIQHAREPRIKERMNKMQVISNGVQDCLIQENVMFALVEEPISHIKGDTNFMAQVNYAVCLGCEGASAEFMHVGRGQWCKFVLGKGNIKKDLVHPEIARKYGQWFEEIKPGQRNDAADAYGIGFLSCLWYKYQNGIEIEVSQVRWAVLNELKDRFLGIPRKKRKTKKMETIDLGFIAERKGFNAK